MCIDVCCFFCSSYQKLLSVTLLRILYDGFKKKQLVSNHTLFVVGDERD